MALPRPPYSNYCPYQLLRSEIKKQPLGESLWLRTRWEIQAIYDILGCDPSAGRDTVEEVIKELLSLGPGATRPVISVLDNVHRTLSTTFAVAYSFFLDFDNVATKGTLVWDQLAVPGGGGESEVQLWNVTDGAALGALTGITSTGTKTLAIDPWPGSPSGRKKIELRHRRTGGSAASRIDGATLYLGV